MKGGTLPESEDQIHQARGSGGRSDLASAAMWLGTTREPSLLPTPGAGNFADGADLERWEAERTRLAAKGYNGNGRGTPLSVAARLLPTPSANQYECSPEVFEPRRERQKALGRNGNGFGLTTAMAVQALLKTPTAQLAVNGGSQHPDKRRAGGHGPTLADQVEHSLLPTPSVASATGGQTSRSGDRKGEQLLGGIARSAAEGTLLPTPAARDFKSGKSNLMDRNSRPLSEVIETGLPQPGARPADAPTTSTTSEGSAPGPAEGTALTLSLGGPTADGTASRTTPTLPKSAPTLLPTPEASDGTGGRVSSELGGTRPSGSKRAVTVATAVAHLLPTPQAHDSGSSPEGHLSRKPGRAQVTSLAIVTENDLLSSGGHMSQPFAAGNPSSEDLRQGQLSLDGLESA